MNKDLENKILEVANVIYEAGYVAGSLESRPKGYEDGYKYGLNIAWKVAKLEDVFKCKPSDIYNMSTSEALEKIKEFQKKDTCNTCVHKNEDNICCGCDNDSEYEDEPKQTEKKPERSCASCAKEYEGCNAIDCIINNLSYWTPKQTNDKIKLGDEVVNEAGSKGIVVGIGNGTLYLLMRDYDMPQKVSKEGYTKTGRYFPQIQELRDQLN